MQIHTAGGRKGYTLQVLTTGGGKGYTLHVLTAGDAQGYSPFVLTVRHPVSPVPGTKKLPMLKPILNKNAPVQDRHVISGMPMPAATATLSMHHYISVPGL
jgi:hypothetical protein